MRAKEWAGPDLARWLLGGQVMEVNEADPWLVQITWEVDNSAANPVRFDVRGRDGQPIGPADTFRRMASVIEDSRIQLAGLYSATANLWESHGYAGPAAAARRQAPKRPGRKPQLPPGHFELVAKLYTDFRDDSEIRYPVQAVAKTLSKHQNYQANEYKGLTDKTDQRVNTWVNRAKKMGIIPPVEGKQNG